MTLRKELVCILALKLLALIALWYLFFSHPIKDHLTTKALAQHFLESKGYSHDNLE